MVYKIIVKSQKGTKRYSYNYGTTAIWKAVCMRSSKKNKKSIYSLWYGVNNCEFERGVQVYCS